jgi:RNA recognition motif-containing protein
MKSIYVGNLPFTASEDEVRGLFSQYGNVQSVKIVTDRETGRPRGFAFVEMPDSDADAAIEGLAGHEMGGRALKINEARPKAPRR